MVKLCRLLQVTKLLHSHLGLKILVQLQRVTQRKVQLRLPRATQYKVQLRLHRATQYKVQLRLHRATQYKVQLRLQLVPLRTIPLQDLLRRPLFLKISNFLARDPILSHQLVMIHQQHNPFPRASYTDRPRRRLQLKVICSDLRAFLPTSLKFYTKMVALARNPLTPG